MLTFTWDDAKDRLNRKKHGVSFDEAATIFDGFPLAVFADPDHSEDEDRYIAVGVSRKARVLLVVHCENEHGTEIRIISARKATRQERLTVFGGGPR
ncbi:MAG: BrnT family toxin [Deltaproteobacteria bacterium]|nr:BrnT family toxin [Deltaproteobacteria bacterium]